MNPNKYNGIKPVISAFAGTIIKMTYYNNTANRHLYFGIIFACLLLISSVSPAQRNLKYENVAKKASELSREEAFGEYSDFLSLNPFIERANLYYQLAELASSMMKDLNPLTDYKRIKSLYNVSDSYYLICEQYINDGEARKDQALFPAVQTSQRRLSAQDVRLYIATKRGIDSIFFAEAGETFKSCTSMIESYYRCMDVYKGICKNNRNINDLYINWDDSKKALSLMTDRFDSVLYFKNLINDKVPGLSFSYKSIDNFKIDGFSPADFRNNAELWDYKSWAVQQQKYYDEKVHRAVADTRIVIQKLDMHIADVNRSEKPLPSVSYAGNSLMEELRNLQEITPLYLYIERKYRIIDFLNMVYDKRNTAVSDSYSVDRQAAYLRELAEAHARILDVDKKMETNYPSIRKNSSESEMFNSLYNNSVSKFKQYVVNSKIADRGDSFTYGRLEIPKVKSSGFYRPSTSGYIVKSMQENDDGSVFLGGASINSQGFSIAFTAFSADARNIKWLKTMDMSKLIYDDCSMSVCNIPAGVMSLISSKNVSDPALTTQTVVKYDIKGTEKYKFTLPDNNLPLGRHMLYDEISENTLLVFYGNTEEWFRDSVLVIQQFSRDFQQKFRSDIKLSGELIKVFPASNGRFILFGNYVELEAMGKKESASLGIFSLMIDSRGNVVKTSVYPSENPRYGICVSRVSPEMFLISGTGGSIRKNNADLSPSEGEPVIIITHNDGGLIYDYKRN
ncbi:MAG: hypothetical protein LBK58_04335 [Prevotellaceae bacterium]|jgi:hypothetical protein|nr:hypothetical protein [Prevotellaceae bacterium]